MSPSPRQRKKKARKRERVGVDGRDEEEGVEEVEDVLEGEGEGVESTVGDSTGFRYWIR